MAVRLSRRASPNVKLVKKIKTEVQNETEVSSVMWLKIKITWIMKWLWYILLNTFDKFFLIKKDASTELTSTEDCIVHSPTDSSFIKENHLQETTTPTDTSFIEENHLQDTTLNKNESWNTAVSKVSNAKCFENVYDLSLTVAETELEELEGINKEDDNTKDQHECSQLSKEAWMEIRLQAYSTNIFSEINKTLSMSTISAGTENKVNCTTEIL